MGELWISLLYPGLGPSIGSAIQRLGLGSLIGSPIRLGFGSSMGPPRRLGLGSLIGSPVVCDEAVLASTEANRAIDRAIVKINRTETTFLPILPSSFV
jgi:hypothetical protein